MSWQQGITWTKGYLAVTGNPDGSQKEINVHAGPFVFFDVAFVFFRVQFYAGFRPTPTWSSGYGNEGEGLFGHLGRWMKNKGWGNLGLALRVKKNS